MRQLNFSSPPETAAQRLDVALLGLLGDDFSRAQVQRLLREGLVLVDGQAAKAAQKLRPGQAIVVRLPDPEPSELIPMAMDLAILHEDEDLIIVNKPPGLVVHPSPGHAEGTLVHGLLHHCGGLAEVGGKLRPGIVHRLDKDTSGALVAAKNDRAHRGLVARFAAGRVQKEYLALVHGRPAKRGRADSGIGRHPGDRKRMSSQGSRTKPALSQWRVCRSFGEASLLRVNIHTGRTHQIRVHLSEAGHPVLGDQTYGARRRDAALPDPVAAALRQAGRQMLHAVELSFEHPISAQIIRVTAPLPADYRAVLRACEAASR